MRTEHQYVCYSVCATTYLRWISWSIIRCSFQCLRRTKLLDLEKTSKNKPSLHDKMSMKKVFCCLQIITFFKFRLRRWIRGPLVLSKMPANIRYSAFYDFALQCHMAYLLRCVHRSFLNLTLDKENATSYAEASLVVVD